VSASRARFGGIHKIHKGPLREQVRAQIRRLILTNRLLPGQAIVIDQLSNDLGVSHTPVREALAMLQYDGLVAMRPYENPRVAEVDESDVREVWHMRLLLEEWAIGRAALALSEETLDEIAVILDNAYREAELGRYDAHLESDIALHGLILEVTENKLFKRLADLVNDQSIRIRWLVEAVGSREEILSIIDEHYALLAALRARDPDLARERLHAHLETGMQRTLTALAGMEAVGM